MRILDNNSDKALNDILILLTRNEAIDMRDTLDQMLAEKKFDHEHILDYEDINRQMTIALYDDVNVNTNPYVSRVIDLIKNGR